MEIRSGFRLTMQRFGREGWFFLHSRDIAGVCIFGPDEQQVLADAEIAIAEVLRGKGEKFSRVKIEAVPTSDSSSWDLPTERVAELIPA